MGLERRTVLLPELPVNAVDAVSVTDNDTHHRGPTGIDWYVTCASLGSCSGSVPTAQRWPAGVANITGDLRPRALHGRALIPSANVAMSLASRLLSRSTRSHRGRVSRTTRRLVLRPGDDSAVGRFGRGWSPAGVWTGIAQRRIPGGVTVALSPMLASRTIVRRRAPEVANRYGDDERNWAAATTLTIDGVAVQPASTGEVTDPTRTAVTTRWNLVGSTRRRSVGE